MGHQAIGGARGARISCHKPVTVGKSAQQKPRKFHLPFTWMDQWTGSQGISPWCDWDRQWLLINGGKAEHAATRAYMIKDVDLRGAFLYRGAAKAQLGFGAERLIGNQPGHVQILKSADMMSQWAGSHYFGSYMRDELPLGLLPPEGASGVTVTTKAYEHEAGYREILSLPKPPLVAAARISELTIYSDFAAK